MSEENIKILLERATNDQELQGKIAPLKESSSEEFIRGLAEVSVEAGLPATEEEIRAHLQRLATELSENDLGEVVGASGAPVDRVFTPRTEEQQKAFIDTGIDILKAITFPGYTIIKKLL